MAILGDIMYEELFNIFKSFDNSKWLEIINNIINYKILDLPVSINSEYADEALIFINDFLSKRDDNTLDEYHRALIDYYASLRKDLHSVDNYKMLHWVISNIKPIKYRYSLVNKFLREDFLERYNKEIGQDLQIGLLSCLSSLTLIEQDPIIDYLSRKWNIFNNNAFILVALRYLLKTARDQTYFDFLNKLIDWKLSSTNARKFIDAFKEFVYQKKSYKLLYLWFEENEQNLKALNDNFAILLNELRDWINYKNEEMSDPYCELLFMEINKENLIPAKTLRNLSDYFESIPLVKQKVTQYLKYATHNLNRFTPYEKTSPIRFIKNLIIIDTQKVSPELLGQLLSLYSLKNESEINYAEANKDQLEKLKACTWITGKEGNYASA